MKLTRHPGDGDRRPTSTALRAVGFDDLDIVDANAQCAHLNYVNRVANGLGIHTDRRPRLPRLRRHPRVTNSDPWSTDAPRPDAAEPVDDGDLPEHAAENRRFWDATADRWVAPGERSWAAAVPTWGMWEIPDDEVTLIPADMTGLDAIELGCGTAYVSAWMARRGARVTGIDNSANQLATARRLAAEHGVELHPPAWLRRGGALPRRVVRLRDLRVRSSHLVRP